MTHSTWEGECRALKAQNRELALQALASDGQASDAYQEAKALRVRVQELECDNGRLRTALDWYQEQFAALQKQERLRRAMTAAITFLGAGTPETAKMVLEQALRGRGSD